MAVGHSFLAPPCQRLARCSLLAQKIAIQAIEAVELLQRRCESPDHIVRGTAGPKAGHVCLQHCSPYATRVCVLELHFVVWIAACCKCWLSHHNCCKPYNSTTSNESSRQLISFE